MADFCITHHTSPSFFGGLTYVHSIFAMENLFAALPPVEWLLLIDGMEWLLPIDEIIATNNWHTCVVHDTSCSIALLLAMIAYGFGGLLRLLEMAPSIGNVGIMSVHVTTMPKLSAKNWLTSNITDAVTGFVAGSHVG